MDGVGLRVGITVGDEGAMVGFFIVGNAVMGFCVGALEGFIVGLAVGLRVG